MTKLNVHSKLNGFPNGLGCTYNENSNSVYCFHYIRAYSQNKLLGVSNLEKTYISIEFTNWKGATSRFASHEGSRCYKDALLKMVSLPATSLILQLASYCLYSYDLIQYHVLLMKLIKNQ